MSNAATRIPTAEPEPIRREIDRTILDQCRGGDPAAMRAFVRHHERMVLAFLSRSLGFGPHVEDLAQEVFLRAARALPQFDIEGSARLSTWLLTIASRLVIDARRERRLSLQPLFEGVAVDPSTPETERARVELGRAIAAAAHRLPEEQRDAFILAEFHGQTMQEIATVLGVSEATAKTRLFRARDKLRHLLRAVWEDR